MKMKNLSLRPRKEKERPLTSFQEKWIWRRSCVHFLVKILHPEILLLLPLMPSKLNYKEVKYITIFSPLLILSFILLFLWFAPKTGKKKKKRNGEKNREEERNQTYFPWGGFFPLGSFLKERKPTDRSCF